jgi:hypothetical protein
VFVGKIPRKSEYKMGEEGLLDCYRQQFTGLDGLDMEDLVTKLGILMFCSVNYRKQVSLDVTDLSN